jgi:hypothetical protein
VHAAELARFESQVVRGPDIDDCAIWMGRSAATYGLNWIRRDGAGAVAGSITCTQRVFFGMSACCDRFVWLHR